MLDVVHFKDKFYIRYISRVVAYPVVICYHHTNWSSW